MPRQLRSLQSRNARLETWKQRVELAREERDQLVPLWIAILNYYRSNPPTNWPADQLKLQVNYVFAWFESLWPRLTFNHPHFACEPMSDTAESAAPTVEAAINGELKSMGFKNQLNRAIFDFMLPGIGIMQLGYYGAGLSPDKAITEEDDAGVSTVSGAAEIAEDEVQYNTSLREDRVNSDLPYGFMPGRLYTRQHKPENFLIDPMATNLDDALWCGIEYVRPISSVKKDPQYKRTQNLHADEAELPPTMDELAYRKKFARDPERTFVRLIQIWDIVERKVLTFNMNHQSFLSEMDWTLPTKRFPFYPMRSTEDNYTFWNQSSVTPWINLIEEFNLTISNRVDHMARNKPKVAFNADLINETQLENYLRSLNMNTIKVEGLGTQGDVRSVIQPIPLALMPADHWGHVAEIRQRMTEISGLSEFDLGGTRPGERPATEVNRIGAAGDSRVFGLGSRITGPMSMLAADARSVMEKYYSKERVTKITGEVGTTEWVTFDGSSLSGEFMWDCNLEDLGPLTRDQKQQRAGIALQLLTPYTQVGSPVPRLDVDPLLRLIGRDLGLTPFLKFFPMTGPPMEPSQEMWLIVFKGMELEPNPTDVDDWHIHAHEIQAELPEVKRDPLALQRLKNHIEAHEASKETKRIDLEAQQKTQQGQPTQAGAPGPAPGQASNNESGGAGAFAGGATQQVAGGADIGNLQSLLRGGA